MSQKSQNKDNSSQDIKNPIAVMPMVSSNPLLFWTNHPKENTLVDLRVFALGEEERISKRGAWNGPFTGRPVLITQLAASCQAHCMLKGAGVVKNMIISLRSWWRLFDQIENDEKSGVGGNLKVSGITDVCEIHAAYARKKKITPQSISYFLTLINDALHLNHMPLLMWSVPKAAQPIRNQISEERAKDLKTALKQKWQSVRNIWQMNDSIVWESNQPNFKLDEIDNKDKKFLISNLQYFQSIQRKTGKLLPSSSELLDGNKHNAIIAKKYYFPVIRGIVFPTLEEIDVAFHMVLMNSGWNPSTLLNLDATSHDLIFAHPKNREQIVLAANIQSNEAVVISAMKPRAQGKMQFCTGLRKNPNSPPQIISALLERNHVLRDILRSEYSDACVNLNLAQENALDPSTISNHLKKVQRLQQGLKSAWLYVDRFGQVRWLDGQQNIRYGPKNQSVSFIGYFLSKVNAKRQENGLAEIPLIKPSDFKDIYARQIYVQTRGNILAVMLALGHSSVRTTGRYIENNIFNEENDESARRFMEHLFHSLENGRVDLTILTQLARNGSITKIMEERLETYRKLQRSRVGVACTDPYRPPSNVDSTHAQGWLCKTQRCLRDCSNARFLPESLEGLAMRVEEILAMEETLPRETWLRADFSTELEIGLEVLDKLFDKKKVLLHRKKWKSLISGRKHIIPGFGFIDGNGDAL